jgi:DNA-binding winged helix-turn-helix (wHTH) protein
MQSSYFYEFGPFRFDPRRGLLLRGPESVHPFPPRSSELLQYLIENKDRIVPRDEIMLKVWGVTVPISTRVLDSVLALLRNSLGDNAENPQYIKTFRRRGIKFVANVIVVHDNDGIFFNELNTHQFSVPNSIEISFDFPPEVKVPCEQYLLYFVQFLKDLGVEATADLRHEAGSVLFSVTPADKETALDNIRTALGTYLQLSTSPVTDNSIVEIEGQRLAATVDNLRGQIRLSVAEMQLKDATIQAQQVTINRLLSGDIMLESMKDVTPSMDKDKEAFFDGTVALTRHNYKGIELNYAQIFRKLRRLFKKDANSP